MEENTREHTVGEVLIGVNFNPSKNTKVDKVKELCAELADILDQHMSEVFEGEGSEAKKDLLAMIGNKALGDILTAQMMIVKAITFNL